MVIMVVSDSGRGKDSSSTDDSNLEYSIGGSGSECVLWSVAKGSTDDTRDILNWMVVV